MLSTRVGINFGFPSQMNHMRHRLETSGVLVQVVKAAAPQRILKPAEIMAHLDRHVIGQTHAKKVLSVAVYNHSKRQAHLEARAAAAAAAEASTEPASPYESSEPFSILGLPFVQQPIWAPPLFLVT